MDINGRMCIYHPGPSCGRCSAELTITRSSRGTESTITGCLCPRVNSRTRLVGADATLGACCGFFFQTLNVGNVQTLFGTRGPSRERDADLRRTDISLLLRPAEATSFSCSFKAERSQSYHFGPPLEQFSKLLDGKTSATRDRAERDRIYRIVTRYRDDPMSVGHNNMPTLSSNHIPGLLQDADYVEMIHTGYLNHG